MQSSNLKFLKNIRQFKNAKPGSSNDFCELRCSQLPYDLKVHKNARYDLLRLLKNDPTVVDSTSLVIVKF